MFNRNKVKGKTHQQSRTLIKDRLLSVQGQYTLVKRMSHNKPFYWSLKHCYQNIKQKICQKWNKRQSILYFSRYLAIIWFGPYYLDHIIWTISSWLYHLDHIIWSISYGPYHMYHIICTISYGPYHIVYIIWPIWVTWWPKCKIYKTDQDEIRAVFDDCRQMGFEFRRPKDFLLPTLLVIIDHNHDGDITNDELRFLWPLHYGP